MEEMEQRVLCLNRITGRENDSSKAETKSVSVSNMFQALFKRQLIWTSSADQLLGSDLCGLHHSC